MRRSSLILLLITVTGIAAAAKQRATLDWLDDPRAVLSPNGAAVISQGREPLVVSPPEVEAPRGRQSLPPFWGLDGGAIGFQGLTPLAIDGRPFGAEAEECKEQSGAAAAPRAALLTYNAKDECCFEAGYALPPLLDAAKPIYRLLGMDAALRSHVNHDPGTHNYEKENPWPA